MKKILISSEKKQYKANLHCHSTRSDGKLTPDVLKEMYKSHGYDILAITDHSHPCSHYAMSDPDFLMLTGYEAYIRESDGPYDPFKREIHMNLFARDPHNAALVCYDPRYTRYIPEEEFKTIKRVGSEEPREYSVEYINKFIKTANENGYIVSYNHPYWSMEEESNVLSYRGLWSLELRNTSSYLLNRLECGEALYDSMLRRGMRLGVEAGDDNHNVHPVGDPLCDSFGWYTVILADKLEYSDVISAMENKDCYVSNGPVISEVSVEDGVVKLSCSPANDVYLYGGSKHPTHVILPKGETATSFELKLDDRMEFFRISVYDTEGRAANTRGFFRDEWEA